MIMNISLEDVNLHEKIWDRWLPNITKREYNGIHVAYNVSDFTIAK